MSQPCIHSSHIYGVSFLLFSSSSTASHHVSCRRRCFCPRKRDQGHDVRTLQRCYTITQHGIDVQRRGLVDGELRCLQRDGARRMWEGTGRQDTVHGQRRCKIRGERNTTLCSVCCGVVCAVYCVLCNAHTDTQVLLSFFLFSFLRWSVKTAWGC